MENEVIHQYLNKIGTSLASKHREHESRLPVLWAPHFSTTYSTPAETTALYKTLLSGTRIDILALQDGFGAIQGRTSADIARYFPAFKSSCDATPSDRTASRHVELWSDAELQSGTNPTSTSRLKQQICSVKPYVQRIICWDFYHYMSKSVPDAPANNPDMIVTKQADRVNFQTQYKNEFVDHACVCP